MSAAWLRNQQQRQPVMGRSYGGHPAGAQQSHGTSGHRGILQSGYDRYPNIQAISQVVNQQMSASTNNKMGSQIENQLKAMLASGAMTQAQYNAAMQMRAGANQKVRGIQTKNADTMASHQGGSNPYPTVCYSFPGSLRGPLHSALVKIGAIHASHFMNDNRAMASHGAEDPVPVSFNVSKQVADFVQRYWKYKPGMYPRWFAQHWGPAAVFACTQGKGLIMFVSQVRKEGNFLPQRKGRPNCDLEVLFAKTCLPSNRVVML